MPGSLLLFFLKVIHIWKKYLKKLELYYFKNSKFKNNKIIMRLYL